LLRAVVVIQAPGRSGSPSLGQRSKRDNQSFLQGILGYIKVAELVDERRHHPAGFLAKGLGNRVVNSYSYAFGALQRPLRATGGWRALRRGRLVKLHDRPDLDRIGFAER
jgi:hypothetical protein